MNTTAGRFTIGDFECVTVTDGTLPLPAANFFHNAHAQDLDALLRRHGIIDGRVQAPFNCLVLRTGSSTVLVDTGFGPGVAPSVGHIRRNLAAAEIDPESIDIVLLSHGHADHAGGSVTTDEEPAFPRARVLLSRAEAEFWLSNEPAAFDPRRTEAARRIIKTLWSIAEDLKPGDVVLPGVTTVPAPGHTPHNLAIRVESRGEVLYYVADAIAHPIHLERPGWHLQPDFDPETAVATRRALLQRAESEGAWVCGYHMPLPSTGRVTSRPDGGWDWRPIASPR